MWDNLGRVTDLGATPEVEKFTLRRLDPIDAYLECDGMRIPGVPVFDAPATGVNGVTGTVAPIEAEPDIARSSCRRAASIPRPTKGYVAAPGTAASLLSAKAQSRALGC